MSTPAEATPPQPPGRLRRALGGALIGLGLGTVFVASVLGAVVIHLDLAPTRRLVLTITNDALGSLFEGKIIAEEIERVSLGGVDIRSAVVLDPAGAQVIRANGIHARADVITLARRAAFGTGTLWIDIPWVRVDDAAVLVERAPGVAIPTIADAFLLRPSSNPTPPTVTVTKPREVRVDLRRIEIGHVWAHGFIAAPRALDADVSRVAGALHLGAEGLTLDVEQTGITDRALLPAPLTGSANYHLRLGPTEPAASGGATAAAPALKWWTEFSGQLGAVEVQARGGMEGDRLTATAEIPHATPEQVATVIPALPVHEVITAKVELDGDIPTFSLHGDVAFEGATGPRGKAEIEGRLGIDGPLALELDVIAHAIDPTIFAPIPATALDATARLKLALDEPQRLQIDAATTAFTFGAQAVPPADVHLVLDRGALSGHVSLHEEGAPIDATITLSPDNALRFEATADVASLRAIPRLVLPVDGAAQVRVDGTLKAGVIDARVSALYSGLRAQGGAEVGHGGLDGHISGSTAAPDSIDLDATLWGRDLKASGYAFDRLNARARGPLLRPQVAATLLSRPPREGAPDDEVDPSADAVEVSGEVDTQALNAREIKVRLRRDGTEVKGTVARVGLGADGVHLDGVSLEGEGTGKIQGGLTVRGGEIIGKVHGEGVNLERVGKLAGIAQRVRGVADFDVDLQPTARGRKGHVSVQIEDGEVAVLTGVSALVTATFDDDKVTTDGLLRLVAHSAAGDREPCSGAFAQVHVSGGEGELPGHLLDPASWARLSGKVHVAADDWDLRCAARLVPLGLFVSAVRGRLSTRFDVERKPGKRFASVRDLFARTAGLEVAGPQPFGAEKPTWESQQLDVQVNAGVDGVSGESTLRVALFDGEVVADASLAVTLDLAALIDRPKTRWATLRRAPLAGRISIPRREVASFVSLPSFAREKIPALSGELRADAYVDGTLDKPFFTARASAFGLAVAQELTGGQATPWSLPLDGELLATYDAEKATVDLHVKDGPKEVANANAEIGFDFRKLLDGGSPSYTAGFYAKLEEAPIGEVPWFADHDVGGHVSGTVAMSGLHEHPEMKIDLNLPDLQIGQDLFFDEGSLKVEIAPPKGAEAESTARVQAHLAAQDGGLFDASAFAGIRWEDGLLPTINTDTRADLSAKAQSLRLTVFHPGVADILSKLDGYLDGDVRLGWEKLAAGDRATLAAKMKVRSGVVHVPQIGQELHDVTITIESKSDGTIELADIRAEGTRGRITGSATAHMNGLRFERADGSFAIARGQEIPLTLEGVPLGNARGTIKLTAEKHENEIRATLGVPYLHLDLPPASGRGVQALDDNPDITVSHKLGAGKEARADDALAWKLIFDVGRVEVAGPNLEVALSGSKTSPPTVELTDKARISGDISLLPGGILQFFGKEFSIEQPGLVRLRAEDTSNPYLNVQARWRGAPEGTRVFVEYIGNLLPITSDKLKFRSDPPLGQPQILAMLLGTGDSGTLAGGVQTGPTPTTQQFAGGVAVELASSQINALLSGTVFKGFSTQFSTNDDGTLRPGVAYAIGDRLHASASYTTGPVGSSSTATGSNLGGNATLQTQTVLTLDWRFLPTWLLRGTAAIGSEQSSGGLDVLWQYRY